MVELLLRKRGRTIEEDRVLALLVLLIEDFEERNYSMAPAIPREVVRDLNKHSRSVQQPIKRK